MKHNNSNSKTNAIVDVKTGLFFLFIIGSGYGLANFHRSSMAVLSPYLASELGITSSQLGTLGSITFLTYGMAQIPIGLISDKIGSKKVIISSSIAMAIGTIIFALAKDFKSLLIARTIIGFAVSGFFVPGLSLVRQWFDIRRVGFFTSLFTAQGSIWTLMSYTPLELGLDRFNFRSVFIAIAVLNLLLAFGTFFIKEEKINYKDISGDRSSTLTKEYIWFLVSIALFGMAFNGARQAFQSQWATTYYTNVFGYDLIRASGLLTIFTMTGIITGPIIGRITGIIGNYKTFISLGLFSVVMWIVFALAPASLPFGVVVVLTILLAASLIGTMTQAFTTLGDYSPLHFATLATGIVNTSNFIGSAFYTKVIGNSLEQAAEGANVFKYIFMAFGLAVLLTSIFIINRKNKLDKSLDNQ